MARVVREIEAYRSLGASLLVVAVLAGGIITSCGGGGGGSDGELCDQCGDSPDGPCLPSITISPGDGQPQCTYAVDASTGTCVVELACRRKVDAGQRRCFPVAPPGGPDADVDYQFRCDGSRPGGTPGPAPTLTATPAPTATVQQTCGNGVVEGTEQCDGGVGNATCGTQGCTPAGGSLSCNPLTCKFDYSLCFSGGAGCRN